jgi:hypothetical protein
VFGRHCACAIETLPSSWNVVREEEMSFAIKPCRINSRGVVLVLTTLPLFACADLFSPKSPDSAERTQTELKVTQVPYVETPAPAPSPQATPPEPPPEPGVSKTPGPTRGTLPKSAISEGIAAGQDALRACYETALKANPALRGANINVSFVILPDGTVPNADALENGTDLTDPDVIECVLSAFEKLTFQKPEGGRVVVAYPVHFERPVKSGSAGSQPEKTPSKAVP